MSRLRDNLAACVDCFLLRARVFRFEVLELTAIFFPSGSPGESDGAKTTDALGCATCSSEHPSTGLRPLSAQGDRRPRDNDTGMPTVRICAWISAMLG